MKRVTFGNEKSIFILAAECPGCGVAHGQIHEFGCPVESCPECGGKLLRCRCKALSIVDELKLIGAIAKRLTREEALNILDTEESIKSRYELQGAFLWVCENVPPQFREELERQALVIIGGKPHGNFIRVPLDKAAEALGVTEEEATPIMEELEAECLYPGWDKQTGEVQ